MNSREIISVVITLCNMVYFTGGHSNVPPGVHPQHYQQNQMHQQQVPVQHMQQQQQHIPMQQQPPMQMQQQQQMQMQQQQMQMQQQQMQPPQMQQVPVQPQMHQQQMHHGHHGQPPQVLNVANIAQEKEHIAEHLSIPMDTSKMTEQELQFHYFKMHDADNNNKLDGCELIKSLIHWHAQGNSATGQKAVEEKLFKDEELVNLIDPILNMDDGNKDGFIDYPEFVRAQQKAAAAAGPPPPPHARR